MTYLAGLMTKKEEKIKKIMRLKIIIGDERTRKKQWHEQQIMKKYIEEDAQKKLKNGITWKLYKI